MFKKLVSVQTLLWLALLLAMSASLSHVAHSFNQFELAEREVVGWLAAIGVDVGLLCLSIGIQRRKRQNRPARGLWLALAFVTLISVTANVSHGVNVKLGEDMALASFASFDPLQLFTMLLLAGALPILTFALAEVAADDANYLTDKAEKEARKLARQYQKEANTASIGASVGTAAHARAGKKARAKEAEARLLAFYDQYPDGRGMTQAEIGAMLDRGRSWVGTKLRQLEEKGAVSRNNGNVIVHQVAQD